MSLSFLLPRALLSRFHVCNPREAMPDVRGRKHGEEDAEPDDRQDESGRHAGSVALCDRTQRRARGTDAEIVAESPGDLLRRLRTVVRIEGQALGNHAGDRRAHHPLQLAAQILPVALLHRAAGARSLSCLPGGSSAGKGSLPVSN